MAGRPVVLDYPKVFIGNITSEISEDDLRKTFEKYGNIKDIRIYRDCKRPFAFVYFDTETSATTAIGQEQNLTIRNISLNVRSGFHYASAEKSKALALRNRSSSSGQPLKKAKSSDPISESSAKSTTVPGARKVRNKTLAVPAEKISSPDPEEKNIVDLASLPSTEKDAQPARTVIVTGDMVPDPVQTFDGKLFPDSIISILKNDFAKPTELQGTCWPLLLSRRDALIVAPPGSGKPLCYILPALQILKKDIAVPKKGRFPRVLVVLNQRVKVARVMSIFEKYSVSNLKILSVVGGSKKTMQVQTLKEGVDIVVATPGRLYDLLHCGNIKLNKCVYVVFDKAEKLLSESFKENLSKVLTNIAVDAQITLWSSDMPDNMMNDALKILKRPVIVQLKKKDTLEVAAVDQSLKSDEGEFEDMNFPHTAVCTVTKTNISQIDSDINPLKKVNVDTYDKESGKKVDKEVKSRECEEKKSFQTGDGKSTDDDKESDDEKSQESIIEPIPELVTTLLDTISNLTRALQLMKVPQSISKKEVSTQTTDNYDKFLASGYVDKSHISNHYNQLIHRLGVPLDWQLLEIYGLDEERLGVVPKPVAGLILVFPWNKKYQEVRGSEEKELKEKGHTVSDKVYFLKQFISNACGTIALIHCVANNTDQILLEDGYLKQFLDDTTALDAEERGKYLMEKADGITLTHKEVALEGQTEAPAEEDPVNFHFVALVHKDGGLYELDGRKSFPINHGKTSSETFLEDAAKVCREIMARDPENIRFTLLALSGSVE